MSGIPIEQEAYARLQDAEHKAEGLDPTKPHRAHEIAAERAERACSDLAAHFAERGAGWRLRLAQYREHKTWGE